MSDDELFDIYMQENTTIIASLRAIYEKAYIGLGKIAEASGNYKEAMKNYKVGGNKAYYSSAFKK